MHHHPTPKCAVPLIAFFSLIMRTLRTRLRDCPAFLRSAFCGRISSCIGRLRAAQDGAAKTHWGEISGQIKSVRILCSTLRGVDELHSDLISCATYRPEGYLHGAISAQGCQIILTYFHSTGGNSNEKEKSRVRTLASYSLSQRRARPP